MGHGSGFLAALACGMIPYFATLSLLRIAFGRCWRTWRWVEDTPPFECFITFFVPFAVFFVTFKAALVFHRVGSDWPRIGREVWLDLPDFLLPWLVVAVFMTWTYRNAHSLGQPPQA